MRWWLLVLHLVAAGLVYVLSVDSAYRAGFEAGRKEGSDDE